MALAQVITINPNQPSGTSYCSEPVMIAPSFSMSANFNVTGMKISFTQGYMPGEDELRLVGYAGAVKVTWYLAQGYLLLSGSTNINDYIEAIQKIQYVNNSVTPKEGVRFLTFSLDDVDYLPETKHYYRFISSPGITWTAARAAAEASTYFGLHGYLATITSYGENAFIQSKTKGVGWIGASDAAVEGDWRWVTGPETGTQFWQGLSTGSAVNGMYNNWNTGEPNNLNNEDYAHITYFANNPAQSLRWNDLPDGGTSGDYTPAGYLIEFGGMPGETPPNITADLMLKVTVFTFATQREFTQCQGVPVELNQPDNAAVYNWTPSAGLSNPGIGNPVATPDVTTEYSVVAIKGQCSTLPQKFKVNVKPIPVSLLKNMVDICIGDKVTLDPGVHPSYLWSTGTTGQTITVATEGLYKVTLTGSNGCPKKDSALVVVHQFPKMDLSKLVPLTCGSLSTIVNISSDKGTYVLTNLSNNQQFQGTSVSVPAWGNYNFNARITDPYGCNSDTSMTLLFHKIPDVKITIDETVCVGYNLQASYVGTSNIALSNFTWIFGGDTISNKMGQNTEQIPLGVNQTKRDLVLKVTEDGCTGSYAQKDIIVIPDLKMFVQKNLQCQPVPFDFSATNTENVVKYEWDWGDGTKGTGKATSHLYTKEGYYDVSLVVTTDKGCMNQATTDKMVYVAPIPTVGFSLSPETCLNQGKDTLKYVGSANSKDTYYWDLKGFDPVEIVQSPDTTAGPFVFDLINKPKIGLSLYVISQYGCRSTTASLEVKRKPLFSFTSSVIDGCAPLDVQFKAKPDDPVDQLSFFWDFGDGGQGSGADLNHVYEVPDTKHDLRLRALSSVTGCTDSLHNAGYITVHPNPKAKFTMDHDIVYNDAPQVIFTDQSLDAINFFWDFGDATHSREKDPVHNYAVVGRRKVIETVYNQFDCQDTTSKSVLVAFSKIFAPNAFSPAAPNEIDRVFLLSSEGIKKEGYHLTILSRWNDIVFECKNEVKGWDGRMSNGNYAPSGNYIWILECTDFLDRPHRQTGLLTLVF
jgi:PKD repeat protein